MSTRFCYLAVLFIGPWIRLPEPSCFGMCVLHCLVNKFFIYDWIGSMSFTQSYIRVRFPGVHLLLTDVVLPCNLEWVANRIQVCVATLI